MFGGLKTMLGAGVVLAVILGGFYWYYNDTQKRMDTLRSSVVSLRLADEINTNTIAEMELNAEKLLATIEATNAEFAAVRQQKSLLEDKLGASDLGFLASKKPELIERLINRGTKNAGRCFELLSGAPITESERNAKNATDFNNECPWLYGPLVLN